MIIFFIIKYFDLIKVDLSEINMKMPRNEMSRGKISLLIFESIGYWLS